MDSLRRRLEESNLSILKKQASWASCYFGATSIINMEMKGGGTIVVLALFALLCIASGLRREARLFWRYGIYPRFFYL